MDILSDSFVAPPRSPGGRGSFKSQLHVLVDEDTRAYIVGLGALVAREAGYTYVRQGEVIRDLLAEVLNARYEANPTDYRRAVTIGRQVLAEPTEGAQPRRA